MVVRAQQKSLELPIPTKIVNHKQCCTTGVTVEISANIKGFKVEVVTLVTSPFNSAVWPVQLNDLEE